jgi:5-methylcytosine-specific restriction endonuclease McrA
MKHKIQISKERVRKAISESNSMGEAASLLNLNFRTFKRVASEHGLYKPTPSIWKKKIELSEILNGNNPQYPTSHLSKRLVSQGILEYRCNSCGIDEYNGRHISLELNHIDGDRYNHLLENLELLCPNCHSQTGTYRSKKLLLKKTNKKCS